MINIKITYINSFEEYEKYIENYKNRFYFRGQANAGWNITPSLFRPLCTVTFQEEQQIITNEMKSTNLNSISALFKLQHYGTPTRICDLTISPYTALFFAVESNAAIDADGAIYIFSKIHQKKFNGKEIAIISSVLEGENPLLSCDVNIKEEIKAILMQNHIIQYDKKFSYSNRRAILQGGTGLLFGFSCVGDEIHQRTTCDINQYISEKIIIPANIKTELRNALFRMGYSSDILYDSFENITPHEKIQLIKNSEEIIKKAEFTKYVAKYRVDSLYFSREEVIERIKSLYDSLFKRFGRNSRIWLFIYYDENDLTHSNWICRTEWENSTHYSVKWTKNYYVSRLAYINEQASTQEIFEKYSKLLADIYPIYDKIHSVAADTSLGLFDIAKLIRENILTVSKISSEALSISFGTPETERIARIALDFICDIDWLCQDILIYADKNHQFKDDLKTKYLLENLYIKRCEATKDKLQIFYDAVANNKST